MAQVDSYHHPTQTKDLSPHDISSHCVEVSDESQKLIDRSLIVKLDFNCEDNQVFVKTIKDMLDCIERKDLMLQHFETRIGSSEQKRTSVKKWACFLIIKSNDKIFQLLCDELRTLENITDVDPFQDQSVCMWVPTHVSDLDKCRHLSQGYQPDVQESHPGFLDKEYRKRRMEIAEYAIRYRHGDPLPEINYTEQETTTWRNAYITLKKLHHEKACKEYVEGFKLLEEAQLYSPDRIPQLGAVSAFLHKWSGFRIRPVAGLVTARDFLASFAFRVFQSTQYVRHHSQPLYTPEPDCIHELLGHMPMLVNREFADFTQKLGLASLGMSDEEIEKLATLYWFTVEFGLIRENGNLKAMGAGLLSSYGELEHAFSDVPQIKQFQPHITAIQAYRDVEYQPVYFVVDSIKEMLRNFDSYLISASRPCYATYDAFTESVNLGNKLFIQHNLLQKILKDVNQLTLISKPYDINK